ELRPEIGLVPTAVAIEIQEPLAICIHPQFIDTVAVEVSGDRSCFRAVETIGPQQIRRWGGDNHHRSSLADHMAEPGPREMDVLVPGGRIDLNPLLRVTAGTASVDDAQVPRVAACATKARAINRLVTSHWRWCKEQGRRCCARDID